MARTIRDKYGTGMHRARTLVRTEYNYCVNQSQLKSLAAAGYDEYEFLSVGEGEDGACDMCDDLDGMRFKIEDAVVGVNCPPMHPNCRCNAVSPRETDEEVQADIDRLLDGRSIEDIERELDRQIAEQNALPEPVESPAEATPPESYSTLNSAQENIDKTVDNSENSGIIKVGSGKMTIASPIETPIEQRHTGKENSNAVLTFGVELNNRQKNILDKLPEIDSRVIIPKKSVNMSDLSALTAKTGDEFALFTKGNERLIVRGNFNSVRIDVSQAQKLAAQGYRWSGHTHPGDSYNCLTASPGDKGVLECFSQETSVIYNSKGQYLTFNKEG